VTDRRGVSAASAHPGITAGRRPDAGSGTALRLASLAGAAAATAFVGLVDPARAGVYPLCPSRVLLGLDCPACGGLRGAHDLVHGRVVEALDHNLLLPGFVAVLGIALALWLGPLVGRPARSLRLPRGASVAALTLLAAFTLLRNLPLAPLEFLAAGP
jgi:hypothetical protein